MKLSSLQEKILKKLKTTNKKTIVTKFRQMGRPMYQLEAARYFDHLSDMSDKITS